MFILIIYLLDTVDIERRNSVLVICGSERVKGIYFYNICKFSSKKGTRKTIATRGYHFIGHQLAFQLKLKEMYER